MSSLLVRARRCAAVLITAAAAGGAIAGAATGGDGGTARAAANVTITARDFFWSPDAVTIQVGDTVTWTNAQGFHNVLLGDSRLNQPGFPTRSVLEPAAAADVRHAGIYTFVCEVHPGMTGTVKVAGGEPTPTPTPRPRRPRPCRRRAAERPTRPRRP